MLDMRCDEALGHLGGGEMHGVPRQEGVPPVNGQFRTRAQVEARDRAVARADLIAMGIVRCYKFKLLSPGEMQQALEVLADELAKIDGDDEALAIRSRIESFGLQIPKPSEPVHIDSPAWPYLAAETSDSDASPLCMMKKEVAYRYVRHGNNQVSAEVEMHIQELLGRGWNKSAIARSLRINRRVVIRVSRSSGMLSGKMHNPVAG